MILTLQKYLSTLCVLFCVALMILFKPSFELSIVFLTSVGYRLFEIYFSVDKVLKKEANKMLEIETRLAALEINNFRR